MAHSMDKPLQIAGIPSFAASADIVKGLSIKPPTTHHAATASSPSIAHDVDFAGAKRASDRLAVVTGVTEPSLTRKRTFAEHVIARTTKLDHARPSSRGRMSSTAAPASANGYELPPNDDFYFQGKQSARAPRFARDSPSASLRGRKAKAFLEQHGSPPGHRVTAGGRIVPDGVWPIKSPTNYPSVPTIHPHALQDGAVDHLNGLLVNVGNQNICQIVNGGFVHVGKENGQLLLVMPPTNDTLSMDGVPLHKTGHFMQHVPANHFGGGGLSQVSIC